MSRKCIPNIVKNVHADRSFAVDCFVVVEFISNQVTRKFTRVHATRVLDNIYSICKCKRQNSSTAQLCIIVLYVGKVYGIVKQSYTEKHDFISMCFSLLALWFPDSFCYFFLGRILQRIVKNDENCSVKGKGIKTQHKIFATQPFIVVRGYCAHTV